MKRTFAMVLASLLSVGVAGCLSAPFQPPSGLVSITKAPLSTEGNWEVGSKKGESSSFSVLGLYASGDCSIEAAARTSAKHPRN